MTLFICSSIYSPPLRSLLRPGGSRAVIAENLLLKQQLIIHSRSRQRAPNLTTQDRALLGFMSLFLSPRRLARTAIIIKPSTLFAFHNALKKQKYRLLYSPRGGHKPDPNNYGPSWLTTIGHAKDSCRALDRQYSRELLDHTFFWTATDLEKKLGEYQRYKNAHRTHSSRDGSTPTDPPGSKFVDISTHSWEKHCRGLFELPIAA